MPPHALRRHPATPCAAVERIDAAVERANGALRVTYRIVGDSRRIVAPPPAGPPRRRDELWRQTCCELFVRDGSGSGYREYNFAPSGDWAAYRFDGYRAGMAPFGARPPRIDVLRGPDSLTLIATVTEPLGERERLGLACVIATDAGISYWALAHPPGRPDFHHECGFALPAPEAFAEEPTR